jgi:3-phosphoshikimate 1-carboxyvinyltransferase
MTRSLLPSTGPIDASVRVPTSKSLTNRALIASAAADGGCIRRPLDCDDTRLLADALVQAGWPVSWGREIIIGRRRPVAEADVNLGNSGTGARLILGLLACVPGQFRVDGTHRLRQRPMLPLVDALETLGSRIRSTGGCLPIDLVGGRLPGGHLRLRPEVSSQFVSSLLLAAPLMQHGLDLEVVGPVPSRPYLDLTSDVLEDFGASVRRVDSDCWKVESGGLQPTTYVVEGDWSAMAFAAAAVAVVGGVVRIGPLSATSSQGDRALCAILQHAGLDLGFSGEELTISGRMIRPFEADLTATPDLFPALVVVAATGPEGSVLKGLDHLKHKESDRLTVMVENLRRIGAVFDLGPTSLVVQKRVDRDHSGVVRVTAADDHRVAMAMAVAALATGELELDDERCVGKSFPEFWNMWDDLIDGGRTRV